jgi:hypothetical protein
MSWSPSLPSGSIFYKYEPFSYTFTGGSNFTVSGSSLVTSFCTVTLSNVLFRSTSGFQTTGSFYGEPLTITSSLGAFPYTLFLNAGRFTTASSSVVLYQNESTAIPLTSSVSIASALVTPTLPPGLSFTGSGTAWNIVGIPTLTSASSNYLFYGSNTSQTVSTYITLQVSSERFTLSPLTVGTSITVGTPITPITITNDHYPVTSTSVTFALSGVLPSGLSGVQNGRTYVFTGTPNASSLVSTSPSSISVTLLASTNGGSLTASVPIVFNYTSTVLFTSPSNNSFYPFYSNIAITPIPVAAETKFSNTSATISSYTASGLPSGLSLVGSNIQGTPTSLSSGSLVTLSATNSSGVSGTSQTTIKVNPVTVSVSTSVATTQTYIVGQAITPVTFTVASAAYTSISLSSWTTQLTNLPPGVTATTSGSTVTLSGVPILAAITSVIPLTLSVTSPDGTTGSASFQYAVNADVFTFIPSVSSYIFAQNVPITPIQINISTQSGTPVLYYTSVNLPIGLYISATGLIQGTPLQSGSGYLSFNATNGYTTVSSPTTLLYTTTLDTMRVTAPNLSNVLVPGTSNNLPIPLTATTVSGISVAKLVSSNYLYGMTISLYSRGFPINLDSNGVPLTYSTTGTQTMYYSTITSNYDSNGIPITVDSTGRFNTVYSFGDPPAGWFQTISFGGTPPYTVYRYSNGTVITSYSSVSNVIDGTVGSCVSPSVVLPPLSTIKLIGSNIIGGETTTSTTQIVLEGTGTQTVTRYVVAGNPYSLYSSTDSVTYSLLSNYTSPNPPLDFQWNAASNVFLIADGTSNVYSNSTPVTVEPYQPTVSIVYGSDTNWYAIGSNRVYTSPDATTWTSNSFANSTVIPIAAGAVIRTLGTRLVIGSTATANNSCLQYFDMPLTASTLLNQATPSNILSTVSEIYSGSILIAAGVKGTSTLCYSSNGASWLPCSNDFTVAAYDVVAGPGLGWISIGSNTTGNGIKYSSNGSNWLDVVGIPSFTSIGPIQWDGTSWVVFVNSTSVYRHDALTTTILDATSWTLTSTSFPTSIPPYLFPTPIYSPSTPPTPILVIGVTPTGPVFTSPTQISQAYQYVPITPIIFDAGPGVVFFLSTTLPNGLKWTTNIPNGTNYYQASISGQSVQTGTFSITVYAQSSAGISRKTISISVNQVFTSVDHATAAAYTAYTREKVIADAAVNARDNRVLPSSVGPFLLDRPKDVETVVICCD